MKDWSFKGMRLQPIAIPGLGNLVRHEIVSLQCFSPIFGIGKSSCGSRAIANHLPPPPTPARSSSDSLALNFELQTSLFN